MGFLSRLFGITPKRLPTAEAMQDFYYGYVKSIKSPKKAVNILNNLPEGADFADTYLEFRPKIMCDKRSF